MFDSHAQAELKSEFQAQYDYVEEAFGDTRVPDWWDDPELPEIMFQRGRGADMGGYQLDSPDYCESFRGWHSLTCPNRILEEEPPF